MFIIYQTIIELKTQFERISNKGWIESINKGKGSIGNTFEKELGLNRNDFEIPDFNGIEIKTKKNHTKYNNPHISLFNATFDGKYLFEIKRLQETYGWPDRKLKESKVLYTSLYGKRLISVGMNWKMKLEVNYQEEKVFLLIYDKNKKLIEKECYWSFELLEEKLLRKLKYLAVINADNKFIKNKEYFYYKSMTIYTLKNFNKFLELLDKGYIRVNIKVGTYHSGKKLGKIYDHGTSFEIKQIYLEKLFDKI